MIASSVLDLIGGTPLLKLSVTPPGAATVLAKLESANPGGSVKDRVALAVIEDAEARGKLKPGGAVLEVSAGNTGLALAIVAAVKGYRAVLVMPENAPVEPRRLLSWLGAEVVLTPSAEGMAGAISAAKQMAKRSHNYLLVRQFDNPANPQAHSATTAKELLEATRGRIDAFVCGVGTGGTLTGVARTLKERIPKVQVVAVEPARSPLLSRGWAGPHGIPGLGPDFVPSILDKELIDQIVGVSDDDAHSTSSCLAREEGLLVGLSSGANVFASLEVAAGMGEGKQVVTILPDGPGPSFFSMLLKEPIS
ncbi:MAG: cysteine synthase A [Dehalococcoidia bacterium]|jgi:cysteine synthase A|nr:cysteine synthase A [Dehalococcoidia bacterium]